MGRKPKAKAEETDGPSNGHVDHLNDSIDQGVFKVNKKKRENGDANGETTVVSRRMPKRAAACADFKEKVVRMSEKEHMVEAKRVRIVEDEISAISLTLGHDVPRPNRRLLDFIFHDENGKPQPVEMLEVTELFITGQILPWDPSTDKSKEQGVKCEGFGRIETWDISGYEDGSPVVWISTDIADYTCVKPAASYKKFYGLFYEKARACIEVYKKLSPASGGDPDVSLEELLAYLVRSLSGSKSFPQGSSIRDFIISQGDFIYNQLIGLDETSKMSDQKFDELAVLVALRDESKKSMPFALDETLNSCGPLKIGGVDKKTSPNLSSGAAEEDEDKKVARLLQEEEYWHSMKEKRTRRGSASSKEFYIKINEDEIANDYPMPAFYKSSLEETDEYIIFDDAMDISDTDLLPRSMLHDWSLYNSDARLISLELLPMKPCPDIDVTIYGSGTMTFDDGSGFCLDGDPGQSSSGSAGLQNLDGIPIFLSAVKEWMIEFGASMIFISIRTDMAWYRLGKPSKQYAPWYETVLKTAEVAIGIITLLKEQTRVARLSFADVIKKVTEFKDDHPAYISSDPKVVERYVIVHGQIILQQFAEYPDNVIRKCAFVSGLREKMELMHHTKWLVKKKAVTKKGPNMNPRAKIAPAESRKKPIPATTTRLINRIWGEFYSNYSPEESNQGVATDIKEDEELEEEEEEVDDDSEEMDDEKVSIVQKIEKHISTTRHTRLTGSSSDLKWDGQPVGKTCQDEALYRQVNVRGDLVSVGSSVLVDNVDAGGIPPIYYIEYMFEKKDGRKMFHGRLMLRGSETVLQNAANEREVFLTNQCADSELQLIIQSVVVKVRVMPWGYQYRKANADMDKNDRERAEDRKAKGLPLEYYCKSVYSPDKGAFFCLPADIGLGNGICPCCRMRETEREKETFKVTPSMTGFLYKGVEYSIQDYVYIAPHHFSVLETGNHTFKGGRNVGLKPYVICHLLEIETPKASRHATPETTKIKVRKFFRPEDISMEKAYRSDIREVYYSEQTLTVHVTAVEGKCEVRKKNDLQSLGSVVIFEHVFFCEHLYDPNTGAIKQLPPSVKLSSRREGVIDDSICRKKKGKRKEEEHDDNIEQKVEPLKSRLATLDIFAGCGGLSEGLQQAGVSQTKWAIEYEEPAGEAFCLNHPETLMFIDNCNVVLSAIMLACGDENDCISTAEATERAAKFDQKLINDLPRPGQVDFINGGPPCQGFSGMNRFNQSAWSKVQCEMILAFLSFADYFRPRYFLLENVRNFVSFNKGQTFRLALASLLEMGYQVRFGILEAGAFGVSQSRKRAFIWAASPEETLPEWPEPMHVFAGPELKITLDDNKSQFAAVRSTANGAPFRPITVRDTIGDLPEVGNGASMASMEYKVEPVSWFQKMIRGDMMVLTDHISKEMNELNLIRCQKIPKRPGADWRDLPDEKVRLSTGQMVDLIPWCLPNTAKRHNQWKGLYGRLDWEGNFPTSITDPQPMGKVGMCFHPDQDRIVTVRECARSQGFRDSYKFAGNIQHRHRQIGNAVPPPLAFALGAKLKEAVDKKI